MTEINKKIKDIIKVVRRRMIIGITMKYALHSFIVGLAGCILFAIISHIMPITFLYTKFLYILAACVFLGVSYVLFHIPDAMYVARVIDDKGLQERTMTALELMESNNPYASIEIEDTYNHLKAVNPKKVISIMPSAKPFIMSFSLVLVLFIILLIPSSHEDIVREKENLQIAKKEVKKEIEKVKKEIKQDPFLSKKDKEDLEKVINDLNKDLAKVNDEKELKKQAEANQKLTDFKKHQAKEKNFDKIAKKMMDNKQFSELGKALNNNEFDKAKEEISDLMQDVSNMSEEDYKKLLESVSDQLAGINMDQLPAVLNQLAQDMQFTNSSLSNSQYASANSNNSSSNSNSGSGSSGNGNQGSNNSGSNGNGSGNNGSGNGNGNGNGNGSGNGSGNGNGNGTSGGTGNGSGRGSGNGRGAGSSNSETTDERLNGAANDENVNGQRGNKEESNIQILREGISIGGEKVPYDQVISEYESKAYESMNMTDIPKGMQEVVKEYFSGLN